MVSCGGRVHYDPFPSVRYRQHGNNLVSLNSDIGARLRRIKMLWDGRFKELNDQHIRSLKLLSTKITPENNNILVAFENARFSHLLPRLLGFISLKLHRQTFLGNLSLIFSTIFNNI